MFSDAARDSPAPWLPGATKSGLNRPKLRFIRHDLHVMAVALRRTNLRRPVDPRLGSQEAKEQRHCIAALDPVQRSPAVRPDREETAPPGRTLLETDDFQQPAPQHDTEGHCPRVAVQALGALFWELYT